MEGSGSPLLAAAVTDYPLPSKKKVGYASTRGRLAHVVEDLAEKGPSGTCAQADELRITGFRKWPSGKEVVSPDGRRRAGRIGGVEGCVRQLAAAIDATPGQ